MKALELADCLDQHAEHHFDAAQDGDMPPCKTRNWDHFVTSKNAAAELRRLAAVESDCAPYLKEGETPAARIKRELGDSDSLMSLYRDVVAERDALKAENERIKALPPVAVRYDFDGYGWQYIDNGSGSDWLTRRKDGEALYALGSKP